MNFFYFSETQSGCYKWRAAIPAKYLQRRGHTVHVFSTQSASADVRPDAMIFCKTHFAQAQPLVDYCKRNGIRVVFDTDDALELVPRENMNHAGLQAAIPAYDYLLRAADVVTTTTETLAEHLRGWNSNIAVIPNSVDPEEWTVRPRRTEMRIGWTGSPTHFMDLPVALDAIRELQKKRDFKFVIQGICRESSLEELQANLLSKHGRKFFKTPVGRGFQLFMEKLHGIRYEFHPSVAIEQYSDLLCNLELDIGLAPLIDEPFNRNKSCIKHYEYTMSGAVTVASDVLPYSAEVPITAKNKRDSWIGALELALQADRERLWRQQRDWVLMHRNIETTVELWERTFTGPANRSVAQAQRNVA